MMQISEKRNGRIGIGTGINYLLTGSPFVGPLR